MDAYTCVFGAIPTGHACALPPIFSPLLCALMIILRYG